MHAQKRENEASSMRGLLISLLDIPDQTPALTTRSEHMVKRDSQVTNQRAGWKKPLLLLLYLLQDANALKGPKLVSGELGGTVTIQCHYIPVSVNRHQRKYWCHVGPPRWVCLTIVSSNYYTHHHYRGRVALTDFPQRGMFVVTLSQLSPDDVGSYRCGIGNENNMFFFSMNLTLPTGGPSSVPTAAELITASIGTASLAPDRCTSETTRAVEVHETEWDSVVPTLGRSKTTPAAKGRQTPGIAKTTAPSTGHRGAGSMETTVPFTGSPASPLRTTSDSASAGAWSTGSSTTYRAGTSIEERVMATTEAYEPWEETAGEVVEATRPSAPISGSSAWKVLQETIPVSMHQALDATEGISPDAGVWPSEVPGTEMASMEKSTGGAVHITAGDSGPQATPSQAPAASTGRSPGKESSVKSALPEEDNSSWTLTLVLTTLAVCLLVALTLLQWKLRKWRRRRRTFREAGRAPGIALVQVTHMLEPHQDQPHVQTKMLRQDSAPTQTSPMCFEQDPETS
ncbi:high affinity immunoglobulin alpha and immunoglobulin mu Fc receptor [Ochotona princeps]|uniref:high affinity immunoglobulin alpha and immunoglobulin mu Fc receptor n=1 Tax=Ochotona princeps TaxID=9978 RepID=UPI002714FD4B|nr:high affinity immunoglobulin alpha and immunoglobulin mu Fc receptor [Ochotona princeps]